MSQLTIDTGFNIELGFELAPMHKRIFAYIIDTFIQVCYVLFFVYNNILDFSALTMGNYSSDESYAPLIASFLIILPPFLYHLLFEWLWNGQSPGKKIMGIKVVSLDGNKASFSQYFLRFLLRSIDFGGSSYLIALICSAFTKNSQRLGDLAAGTTLVSTELPYSIDDTIFKRVSTENYLVTYPEVMRLSDRDLNTINAILTHSIRSNNYHHINNVTEQIKHALGIVNQEEPMFFLQKLLQDYNYLTNKNV
jgi:uncharacterized RDD family membrane protein YckC